MLRIQRLDDKSVDLDEVAHHEPPHQDLRYLQIRLFSSLVSISTFFSVNSSEKYPLNFIK